MSIEESLETRDEPATTDADAMATVTDARPSGWRRLVPALIVVALVVPLTLVGWHNHRQDSNADSEGEVRDLVPGRVARLLTYTPETVKSDLETELTWLTGDFARDFEDLTNDRIIPVATEAKVSQEAVVDEAGVESVGSDQVALILFLTVTTTSPQVSAPQIVGQNVRVTVVRRDDAWLISEFDSL